MAAVSDLPTIRLVGLHKKNIRKLLDEYGDGNYYGGSARLIIDRIPPDAVYVECNGYRIGRLPKRYNQVIVPSLRDVNKVKAYVGTVEDSADLFAEIDVFK